MIRRLVRSDSGASLLELSIVAPVLIILVIGLIEVGRYTFMGILAANAARAGAQYGAQDLTHANDPTGIAAAAKTDGQNLTPWVVATPMLFCSQNNSNVTCPVAPSTPAPGVIYYVKVQVTGTFTNLMHYPGIPNNIPVSGTSVMRVILQ